MFCYVILHYKNINDTKKCLDSIISTMSPSSRVVVVDNGSNDGSGEELKKEYASIKTDVLILEDNVGFSKGNNAGFRFAKYKYAPDYIIFSNNDVVFYQNDFEKTVENIYNEKKFDVLGPDVYIPKNEEHQNPIFLKGITIQELSKELDEYKDYEKEPSRFKNRLRLHWLKNRLVSKNAVARKLYSVIRKKDDINYRKEYENVGLQGSCIIISKKYIQNEDKMFEPEPFLYCEEEFLYYKCHDKGYKILYSPLIGIRHEEAASFKNANRNEEERLKFMLRHHVESRKMLLGYLEAREHK